MDRFTGKRIGDHDAMLQSLAMLFTTRKRTRLVRRQLGSDVPDLVDKPLLPQNEIDWFEAIATAIYAHEPRFRVKQIRLDSSDYSEGRIYISLEGIYVPTGTAMSFEGITLSWK